REERFQRSPWLRDLEDRQAAAGAQDTSQFHQAGPEVGDVPHAEADRDAVEDGVREREGQHVSLDPFDRVGLPPCTYEHLAGEVEPRDDAALALGREAEVAGPATRVEHARA